MIGRLRGTLAAIGGDRILVMTPGGVGYEVLVPASLFETLGAAGDEVELHTALVVRDDALLLFGFSSARDRELFLRLQSASGVGPRLALAILGALPARRVIGAIRSREPAVLQSVSGVGRKTAERLVLELADKLDDLGAAEPVAAAGAAGAAIDALRALGYTAAEAEAAIAAARRELGGEAAGTEALVRAALRHL
ncbi:MAG: Holliday junction branch migration protein RuvA [Gemmatimonadota bacterium]|jgi:holliday junction DNA helicase RuvA